MKKLKKSEVILINYGKIRSLVRRLKGRQAGKSWHGVYVRLLLALAILVTIIAHSFSSPSLPSPHTMAVPVQCALNSSIIQLL